MRTSQRIGRLRALVALGAAIAVASWVIPAPTSVAQEPGTVSVRDFFKGTVTKLTKKGEIELLYDFEDPAQLADFEPTMPYRAIRSATQTLEPVASSWRSGWALR